MATKGKDKILEGQIAFDFLAEMQPVKVTKPKKAKVKNVEKKVTEIVQKKKFRKANLNIKHNHFKVSRKVRRIPRRKSK